MNACSGSKNELTHNKSKPFIWLGIIYGILTSLFVIFIIKNRKRKEGMSSSLDKSYIAVDPSIRSSITPISEVFVVQDDLTKILGIGPVISNFLKSKGINSFTQLSELTPTEIKKMLAEKKFLLQGLDTWPEQASIAAKGDWEQLTKMQQQKK